GRPVDRLRGSPAAGAATHPKLAVSGTGGGERNERTGSAARTPIPCAADPVSLVFAVPPNEAETACGADRRDPGSGQLPGSSRFVVRPAGCAVPRLRGPERNRPRIEGKRHPRHGGGSPVD